MNSKKKSVQERKYKVGQLVLAQEGKDYILGMIKNVRPNGYDVQWVDDFDDGVNGEPYYDSDVDRFVNILQTFLTDRAACDKMDP
jgi:hypothetical protein